MALVPFFDPATAALKRGPVGAPPADPLARASWLHQLLCLELYEVTTDPSLRPTERREQVARLASKITAATPAHEVAAARDALRADESASAGKKKLDGTVTSARGAGRPMRAAGPRGKG